MKNNNCVATAEGPRCNKTSNSIHRYGMLSLFTMLLLACGNNHESQAQSQPKATAATAVTTTTSTATPPPAAQQQSEPAATPSTKDPQPGTLEIPILCYHQIRDYKPTDSKTAKVYIMPVATFNDQIRALHDSGYHAILPDQLMDYLQKGKPLPSKPVMLTFDDAPQSQIDRALPELDKAGFKAVFFIMTVVLGHNNYMTKDEVKKLSEAGHVIGCHTWNHTMVTKYKKDADWQLQVEKPRADLEKITGLPVKYFAYPFGIWDATAAQHIKTEGFTAAFGLAKKQEPGLKMFTIRRMIADPQWDGKKAVTNVRRFAQPKAEARN